MIRLIDILLEDTLTERAALSKVKDFLTGKNVAPRAPGEPIQIGRRRPEREIIPIRKRGEVWETKAGKFGAKNGNEETRYFTTREAAETYSKGGAKPKNRSKSKKSN